MKRGVTLKQIAEATGVSVPTVSQILNRRPGNFSSEKTKRKVFEAAKRMQYRQEYADLVRRGDPTNTVAIVCTYDGSSIVDTLTMQLLVCFDEMGFSSDMVTEACNRTILSINKPDFKYTDRILTSWYEQQVKTISDLQGYDRGHAKSASARSQQPPASGSFNRFSQRKYSEDDYVSIEQRMLNKKQG